MFAGQKHLDNLCVMVDRNNGQLDMANRMVFPMPELEAVFTSFGWQVHSVDATQYDGVYAALEQFRYGPRNGKPTAIICHGTKGHGALSDFLNKHKVTVPDALIEQEMALQAGQRRDRVERIQPLPSSASTIIRTADAAGRARSRSRAACISTLARGVDGELALQQVVGPVLHRAGSAARQAHPLRRRAAAAHRSRRRNTPPATSSPAAMKVFARDPRVVSIDSDLATTSGLEAGVAAVDQRRALNVGVAEANMMLHRRGIRGAGLQRLDQHVLPVLRLEGAAPHRRRPSGASRSDGAPGRLAERGTRARPDDAGDRRQLRDAHQRRHTHGQRRQH